MTWRRAVSAALALWLASPADAAIPAQQLHGVWSGTIGTLPVRACIVARDDDLHGAYYYRSKLATIPLVAERKVPDQLTEGWADTPKVARWIFDKASPDRLDGRWQAGGRKLAIRLVRVPFKPDADETPCSSIPFHQPRLSGIRLRSTPAVKDGLAITQHIVDYRGHFESTRETFTLAGQSPAIARINARLRKPLGQGVLDWIDCERSALASSPFGGADNMSIEPRLNTARWLVVNEHWDGYCGGAHPDNSNQPLLFDRRDGRDVNLLDWFRTTAVNRERLEGEADTYDTLTPGMIAAIMGPAKPSGDSHDDECDEVIRNESGWNAELTRKGMIFTPQLPHVSTACADGIVMPFAAVRPWLTDEGQREVKAFERSLP